MAKLMTIKVLKLSSLVLLLGIVALCSLWLNNIGNKWWYSPLVASFAALGIFSSWFLGDKDSISKNIAQSIEKFLFASKNKAFLTLVILLLVFTSMALLAFRTWPANREYLAIQAYRKSAVKNNFAVGVIVFVHSVTDGITRQDTINENGFAKISGIPIPTSAAIQLNEVRNGTLWTWGTSAFDIKELPLTRSFDLAEIPLDKWTQVATPSSNILSTVNLEQKITKYQTVSMKGDISFQKDNAPWGLPEADLIINRYSYILGLTQQRTPKWVAYSYSPSSLELTRKNQFQADPAIPKDVQATNDDYKNSGYDKGHLVAPRDVEFKGELAMLEADYLTTLTPQTPELNRHQWLNLERATRQLAMSVGQVYILAGPLYLDDKKLKTIGPNKIPVPTHFFRIVCWISSGELKTASYLVPNDINKNLNVSSFGASINEIEKKANFICMPNLKAKNVQSLKTQVFNLPGL